MVSRATSVNICSKLIAKELVALYFCNPAPVMTSHKYRLPQWLGVSNRFGSDWGVLSLLIICENGTDMPLAFDTKAAILRYREPLSD